MLHFRLCPRREFKSNIIIDLNHNKKIFDDIGKEPIHKIEETNTRQVSHEHLNDIIRKYWS